MLGINRRTSQVAWTAILTLFLFVLALFITYEIRRTLLLFALAVVLAHLLSPVVNLTDRLMRGRLPRAATLTIVYVAAISLIVIAMIPLGSRLSQEAASLANRLPDLLTGDPLSHLPVPKRLETMRPEVTQFIQQRLEELESKIGPMLAQAGTRIITGVGALAGVILIPIVAFFFLKDGAEIRAAVVDSFHGEQRKLVDNILTDIHDLLSHYIRALVLLAVSSFTCYSIFLAATGGPYPILLAGLAGLLEFVPAVGPFVGAVTVLVVTGVAGYPHLIALVVFLAIYRLFQDYVLSPALMGAGVQLHPMLVLFGVLAGEQLAGIPGMFFSVPVMAALRLIYVRLRARRSAPH
jgi:predicted PurR-regulated permease PerM